MDKKTYEELKEEFGGEDTKFGFAAPYKTEIALKEGLKLELRVTIDDPQGADLREGEEVKVVGFIGEESIAIEHGWASSPWASYPWAVNRKNLETL